MTATQTPIKRCNCDGLTMSTVNHLSLELSNLISESKRRNSEIKHASEKSLSILRTYTPSVNESVFLESLSQNEDFIVPFLLSCSTRNAKFSTIAIQSLHKLIQSKSIPVSKLDSLIDAFIEATHLAVDIQLRVLQILPTFFQSYSEYINGELVAKVLTICSILQSYNKTPMVVNTAAATEQQLIMSLFDKVVEEDKAPEKKDLQYEVKVDEDSVVKVSSSSFDCFRVFRDLCSLIEHQKSSFLQFNTISELLGFELIEMVLINYKDLFLNHVEFAFLVRTRITPLLLRSFSNQRDFSIVVRVSRTILLLVRTQLSILEIEAEVIMSFLTHVLTKDSNVPNWKKILSLEVFNRIFQDFELVKLIFRTYDDDYDNGRKKIIGDVFGVFSSLTKDRNIEKLLKPSEVVKPPDSKESSISQQNSSLKVAYLDLLDKLEAPGVPETYQVYLILNCINSFGEGLGRYVLNKSKAEDGEKNTFTFLSDLSEEEQQNLEFRVLKSIITSTVEYVVNIGNEFLYSCISGDLFHSLIRSLQKLCHSAGILGLDRQRDSLLLLFSIATVSNGSKVIKTKSRHNSIGDFLVDQFTTSVAEPQQHESKFHKRDLNSRHVICFRALISLSVSLGPILSKSWKFILITIQWFDYYINGPSKFLSFKEIPAKPELAQSDLRLVESSLSKLTESTKNYDDGSFIDLVNQLIALSQISIYQPIGADDPLYNNELNVCPYNREFFIDKLSEFSNSNASRFVLKNTEYQFWDLFTGFLTGVLTSKQPIQNGDDLKLNACLNFNSFIKESSKVGFKQGDDPETLSDLEVKLFKSLSSLIEKLLEIDDHVSSVQLEMVHSILDTLFELLDRFGPFFKNSWSIILDITNTPFIFLKSKAIDENKNMINSSKSLLKSSFEILQLILNDFLQSIKPLKTTKRIIDVLNNFVSQEIDLNISFSAVSYYWLLSDFFRQKSLESENKITDDLEIETFEELNKVITDSNDVKINGLWLYLLNSLVQVSNDDRIEIKNVAIQTFFRIVDSHGSYLNWHKTFNLVVKDLLLINLNPPDVDDYEQLKTFNDNVSIVLKGVTNLYSLFFINNHDVIFWTPLLEFYEKLVSLHITEISTNVYASFNQILKLLSKDLPREQFEIFFNFWSSQKVKYVASGDSQSYQDSLVTFISGFRLLYNLSDLTRPEVESALVIFNSAIRFPFLPGLVSDVEKPTNLQDIVLESIKLITLNEEIEDLVLVQLSNLVLLPIQTRPKILKKLQSSNKRQISSFIASSFKSNAILAEFLEGIEDFEPLISNRVLIKVIRNLLDAVKYKPDDDYSNHSREVVNSGIWRESISLVVSIFPKILPLLDTTEPNAAELWTLVIETATLTLPSRNENSDSFNLRIYQSLKVLILENLFQDSLSQENIKTMVSSVWKSSFLYENNMLENYLFENNSSPEQLTKQLLSLDIDGYSTEPIRVLPQQSFRLICLSDLFEFSNMNNKDMKLYPTSLLKLVEVTLPFLLCRLILIIRRYSDQQKLVNHLPVYTVQKRELTVLLQKLYELLKQLNSENLNTYDQLLSIFPFILDNQPYLAELKDSQKYLTGITVEFYRLTT